MHHAAICDLDKVLFVVANEFKPIYATMITVPREKRVTYVNLVIDHVYEPTLKWAYTAAWNDSTNPEQHFPTFREEAISTNSYSVEYDTVVYQFAIWRILCKSILAADMPLPIARMIVPAVVYEWDVRKGRIDEMSGYLAKIQWKLSHATPKQLITLREIKKIGLNSFIVQKHCTDLIPREKLRGRTFTQIRKTLAKREGSLSAFCLTIARTYNFLAPLPAMVTRSPKKRWLEMRRSEEEEESQQAGLASVTTNLNQRAATAYCEKIQRNKLERFQTDPELNRIRLDKTLNHELVNVKGMSFKCTYCSSGRGGKHSSAYKCPTCCVFLCMRCHTANAKKNCACKWHTTLNLANLGRMSTT